LVRRDGAEARKERLERIARRIMAKLNKENEISLSEEIAEIQYESGLTKEKVVEYLQILEKLQRFIIDGDRDRIKRLVKVTP
jgi:metal-responsive CopG/Arc/MetJ family transcriptional regulator